MRIFEGFDNMPVFRKAVVTVGSFDGVHEGHREIFGQTINIAKEIGGESVALTFNPHPRQVFERGGGFKLLTTFDEKAMLLEDLGVDNLVAIPFTREFAALSSDDFVYDYLVGKVGVHTLVVGYNHHFGRNKEGNYDYINSLNTDFATRMVARKDVGESKVSSTIIRNLIESGQLAEAAELLGYGYFAIADYDGSALHTTEIKLIPPAGMYDVRLASADGRTAIADARIEIAGGVMRLRDASDNVPRGKVMVRFR